MSWGLSFSHSQKILAVMSWSLYMKNEKSIATYLNSSLLPFWGKSERNSGEEKSEKSEYFLVSLSLGLSPPLQYPGNVLYLLSAHHHGF